MLLPGLIKWHSGCLIHLLLFILKSKYNLHLDVLWSCISSRSTNLRDDITSLWAAIGLNTSLLFGLNGKCVLNWYKVQIQIDCAHFVCFVCQSFTVNLVELKTRNVLAWDVGYFNAGTNKAMEQRNCTCINMYCSGVQCIICSNCLVMVIAL